MMWVPLRLGPDSATDIDLVPFFMSSVAVLGFCMGLAHRVMTIFGLFSCSSLVGDLCSVCFWRYWERKLYRKTTISSRSPYSQLLPRDVLQYPMLWNLHGLALRRRRSMQWSRLVIMERTTRSIWTYQDRRAYLIMGSAQGRRWGVFRREKNLAQDAFSSFSNEDMRYTEKLPTGLKRKSSNFFLHLINT